MRFKQPGFLILLFMLMALPVPLFAVAQTSHPANSELSGSQELLISEFVASNENGLADEDGDESDWIEIYNPNEVEVDLSNWYLTDDAQDLTKWRFPAVTLAGDRYFLLFASGKDRRLAGRELHTNFKLSGGGEFLGLIAPDGATVVHSYAPNFPQQFADTSYGLAGGEEKYFRSKFIWVTVAGIYPVCFFLIPVHLIIEVGLKLDQYAKQYSVEFE
mgnify:CR=1 FL=1